MTYDRRRISPQHVDALMRAARDERSKTIKSYVTQRSFMTRVIDTLKNGRDPATSQLGEPAAAR